jgi:NADPH-dependent 2,4-dienoyl-CoA reductase/sulfur reductase-like enzyme
MTPVADVASLAEGYDLAVVGAGPAGMSAACTAARLGVRALVVDENATPGGQIYRGVTRSPVADRSVLGEDYWRGETITAAFAVSGAAYAAGATVWSIASGGPGFEIGVAKQGQTRLVGARHVILATGALERPFPVAGWTLPGVMTAGAAQIALKASGLVPEGRVVLAGTGPLLYLLGLQLRRAGANIVAALDTTPRDNWRKAAAHLPDFLNSPYLGKGLKLLLEARRRLPFIGGVTGLAVAGTGKAERVAVEQGQRRQVIDCDLVLLHQGVIPNINISNALGCAHVFDEAQYCWRPMVDEWFAARVAGLSIAGDGAGIGGAESAAWSGEIAALAAACKLGRIDGESRDREASRARQQWRRAMRGRRFLDMLYKPAQTFLAPRSPDVIVCRCEEVTAGQIRETVRTLAVPGPNQLKAFLRCGMGPCQGRLCGPTVTAIMAEERGVPMAEIGYYRLRPPFKPITVGEIASLPPTESAIAAVVR